MQLDLVWWHIIIRWIILWKDWIALLWSMSRSQKRFRIQVNVHLKDISSAAEPSVTKLGMVMQHHGPKWPKQGDWFAVFKFRVTVRAGLIKYDCFYHICWTADHFANKLNWMVLISWSAMSSSSGSQWGLVWSNMTVSIISAELLIILQTNLIGWYIIISWSALCKNQIVVFKVWSRPQWRFKTLLNLYVSYIFCTAELLAAKLVVLFYY